MISHQTAGAHQGLRPWNGRPTITIPRARRSTRNVNFTPLRSARRRDRDRPRHPDDDGCSDDLRPRIGSGAAGARGSRPRGRDQAADGLGPVPSLIERHRGRRGVAALEGVLADLDVGAGLTFSELEERFLVFLIERGLPRPELNAPLDLGDRFAVVDCLWRRQRLVVELDGHGVHSRRVQRDSDTRRDRELLLAGWRVIRVTWRHLHDEGDRLATDLNRLLGSKLR